MAKVEFEDNSERAIQAFMRQIASNMQDIQAEYALDMNATLTNTPRGRYWKKAGTPDFYEVSGPGPGVHRASRPGDPPTVFSGELRDTIQSVTHEVTRTHYKGAVTTKAKHAALMEFGGYNDHGNYVAPRPAWLPTLVKNKGKYSRLAAEGLSLPSKTR